MNERMHAAYMTSVIGIGFVLNIVLMIVLAGMTPS